MKKIVTKIIPDDIQFYNLNVKKDVDYKAISIFSAIGFFLGADTYYTDLKVMQPGKIYSLDENSFYLSSEKYFDWSYEPSVTNFKTVVNDFSDLLLSLTKPYIEENRKIILPLSGGLDSRTLAACLNNYSNVFSYSYSFQGGLDECKYGNDIAKAQNFKFREYRISKGYLWSKIELLKNLNKGYSDFVNPRQIAISDDLPYMGDVFFLGHWGDVMFDNYGLTRTMSEEEQIDYLINKLVKKSGLEFANDFWNFWVDNGKFEDYLKERLFELWRDIKITNLNAKFRAFKSLYWAPRWTSVGVSLFKNYSSVFLPFYSDQICNFITSIPEEFLSNRKIQIEFIKRLSPSLANIEWQDKRPFNLYNFNSYPNLYYKIFNIAQRIGNQFKEKKITKNWELQYLGDDNMNSFCENFNATPNFLITNELFQKYFQLFYTENQKKYAHSISMILTLSNFDNNSHN